MEFIILFIIVVFAFSIYNSINSKKTGHQHRSSNDHLYDSTFIHTEDSHHHSVFGSDDSCNSFDSCDCGSDGGGDCGDSGGDCGGGDCGGGCD